MGLESPGVEAPFKYTKDSFIGVRDAWLTFAADRLSKAAAALKQYAEKLPEPVKSIIPLKSKPKSGNGSSATTTPQSAQS
jgi:hypothetical protein